MSNLYSIYTSQGVARGRAIKKALLSVDEEQIAADAADFEKSPKEYLQWIRDVDPFYLACVEHCRQEIAGERHNARLHLLEWRLQQNRWPTLFVESADLVQMLYRSRFDITPDSFRSSWPVFTVAFPKGTKIDGLTLEGCAFGSTTLAQSALEGELMHRAAGKALKTEFFDQFRLERSDDRIPLWAGVFKVFPDAYWYGQYTGAEMAARLADPKHLGPLGIDPGNAPEVDEKIRIYQRVVASLLIYMQAFPDVVEDGLPAGLKARDARAGFPSSVIKGEVTGIVCKAPVDRATGRAVHLRRGHFATLRDERFTRNPDGTMRVIWRSESVVGGEIDPHTIKK